MSGTFAALETGFPELEGKTTGQKLQALTDYLHLLLEQLRYTLRNLGAENLSPAGAEELGKLITEPVRAQLTDLAGSVSELALTAGELKAQVTDGQGNYTVLNLRPDGLHVGDAAGTTKLSGSSLVTGSVTAAQIAAHTITGDELHANVALSAPVITGGSVTGAEVTSKTRVPGLSYDSAVRLTDGEVAFYYGTTLYGKLGIYDAMGNLICRTENDVALKLSAPLKLDSNSYGGTLPSGLGISDAGRLFFQI